MTAETLQLIILPAGIIAVLFAIYLARDVLSRDTGTKEMEDVAGTIFEGAVAFIRRQYTTIAILAVVGAVVIGLVITIFETADVADTDIFGVQLGWRTGVAFLVGAACSMASGIIGMYISVKANVRTAAAARRSLVEAVQVAMRGGAVSGFLVVALSLLGVYGIFVAFDGFARPDQAPFLIVGFGFGASFVALFAQLGGGIYTKAADVGSDLVGKVEKGIPEDDPRNAGVVADLVGDNVGDCAGRGADLFESTAAENIGAMILGVGVFFIARRPRLAEPPSLDLLPARRACLRAAVDDRRDLLRPRQGRREPDEHAEPRLLGHDDPVGGGAPPDDERHAPDDRGRPVRHPGLGLLLRGRHRRPRDERCLRLHHPVLHRGVVPTGSRDRGGVADGTRHEHHLGHGRRLRDDVRHGDHDRHRALCQPLARIAGRASRMPTAATSAASSAPPSRRWRCS